MLLTRAQRSIPNAVRTEETSTILRYFNNLDDENKLK
jgi:hypothetical protein